MARALPHDDRTENRPVPGRAGRTRTRPRSATRRSTRRRRECHYRGHRVHGDGVGDRRRNSQKVAGRGSWSVCGHAGTSPVIVVRAPGMESRVMLPRRMSSPSATATSRRPCRLATSKPMLSSVTSKRSRQRLAADRRGRGGTPVLRDVLERLEDAKYIRRLGTSAGYGLRRRRVRRWHTGLATCSVRATTKPLARRRRRG